MISCSHGIPAHGGVAGLEGLCAACLLEQGLRAPLAKHGDAFGAYEILCEIGDGGMGIAYLAEQTGPIRREVALKVLKPGLSSPDVLARFETERQALALMDHPNIARFFDAGTSAKGRPYFVMEFVNGVSITDYCDRETLSVSARLALLVQVSHAVDHAHRKGIIHRDIKPSNVLIAEMDGVPIPKVIDFGVAKAAGHLTGRTVQTQELQLIGTLEYMSPEQASLSHRALDATTDVYSLGIVLYQLLCGALPFDAARLRDAGIVGVARIICEEEAQSPSQRLREMGAAAQDVADKRCIGVGELRRLLSGDLAWILRKALEKDSSQRYVTAMALAADIERYLRNQPVQARAPCPFYRARKFFRRHPVPVLSMGLVLALLLAAGLFLQTRHSRVPLSVMPLTTYRGNETSPAFSPDGTEVAFAWNGERQNNYDIYSLRIGDPMPRRLTSDSAADYSPAWSPDGKWIAFLHVKRDGNPDIMLVDPHGIKMRHVAATHMSVNPQESRLAWSLDSRWLVLQDGDGAGQNGIYGLSIATGERRSLSLPTTRGTDMEPSLSPDGRTLAFVRDSGQSRTFIMLLPLDSEFRRAGSESRLAAPGLEQVNFNYPRWISSSELLSSVSKKGLFPGRQLWRVSVHGGKRPEALAECGSEIGVHALSRKGHRLVFSRDTYDTNIWSLQLNALAGRATAREQIIASSRWDQNPALSPDGSKIAFESTRTGFSEIWITSRDGSNVVPLTRFESSAGSPRWSPDGSHIAFDSSRDGQVEIYTMPATGGQPKRITYNSAPDILPAWSADGKWIYFCSTRSGSREIWRAPAEGGPSRRITFHGGFDAVASPDGSWIYYVKNLSAINSIWRVPADGGEETMIVDGVRPRCFDVTSRGLYFGTGSPTSESSELQFLDFVSAQIHTLAKFDRILRYRLSVSRDDHLILYSQVDQQGGDLMLAENFR
jgi:Tol biopolymer transport system component